MKRLQSCEQGGGSNKGLWNIPDRTRSGGECCLEACGKNRHLWKRLGSPTAAPEQTPGRRTPWLHAVPPAHGICRVQSEVWRRRKMNLEVQTDNIIQFP